MRKLKSRLAKKTLVCTLSAAMAMTSVNFAPLNVQAAGNYNYGDALSKALLFYQIQESGKLSEDTKSRINWRADSCLNDGADVGLDLTGGWFDAGDHVKFNLPMAFSSMMLGWSYLNNPNAYKKSGQEKWLLHNVEWANDYFVKCNPDANTYYYQVGDGGQDHGFWGAPECVEAHMKRPAFKVDATSSNGGSCVTGEAAASLAVAYLAVKDSNPAKAAVYLDHAKTLFEMADKAQSDAGYKAANGYYTSWSGFQDELALSAAWLYKATGEKEYLDKAEKYAAKYGEDAWPICWDDVHLGALMLLADITGKQSYYDTVEASIEPWISLRGGSGVEFTSGGLGWCSQWGSVRYAGAAAFMAAVYSGLDGANPTKAKQAANFAEQTVNYTLGSSGQAYMCGYNDRSPVEPHHRAAHGTWYNSCEKEPHPSRHVLVGAIVGGPESASDSAYKDDRTNYITNEVACDYNAGFTGACAFVYEKNGFGAVKDASAIETPDGKEYIVDKSVSTGNDSMELKVTIYNHTAWPARVDKNLKLRLFFNIGKAKASSFKASTTYCQYPVSFSEMKPAEDGLYYIDADVTGAKVYPGGENVAKCEMQIRVATTDKWNAAGLEGYALYSNGELVLGSDKGEIVPPITEEETTEEETTEEETTEEETTDVNTSEDESSEEETTSSAFGEVPGSRIPTKEGNQIMVFFKSADGKMLDEHRYIKGDKATPSEWIVENIEHEKNGWGNPVVIKIAGWRSTLTGEVYPVDQLPKVTAPVSYYAVFDKNEIVTPPTQEETSSEETSSEETSSQEPSTNGEVAGSKIPTRDHDQIMVFFKNADGKQVDEHRCAEGEKVTPSEWIVNNIEHEKNGWGKPVVVKIKGWRSTLTGKVYPVDQLPEVTEPVSYYAVF